MLLGDGEEAQGPVNELDTVVERGRHELTFRGDSHEPINQHRTHLLCEPMLLHLDQVVGQGAVLLLTFAFASEVLEKLPVASLRESLERDVLGWLGNAP